MISLPSDSVVYCKSMNCETYTVLCYALMPTIFVKIKYRFDGSHWCNSTFKHTSSDRYRFSHIDFSAYDSFHNAEVHESVYIAMYAFHGNEFKYIFEDDLSWISSGGWWKLKNSVCTWLSFYSQSLLHLENLCATRARSSAPKLNPSLSSYDTLNNSINIAICCIDKISANSTTYEVSFVSLSCITYSFPVHM